jgi:hypothetical protein
MIAHSVTQIANGTRFRCMFGQIKPGRSSGSAESARGILRRGGLPATWCLPTQRLPFLEGDQQARLINGAAGGWWHSARTQKKPRRTRG